MITTSAPAKLSIKQLNVPFAEDVMLFEINVTDKNGLPIADAKIPVTVKVEGAGELIGIDNGQLDFAGPYKTNTRDAYNGRLLVTVKKIGEGKGITLTAESNGLASALSKKD